LRKKKKKNAKNAKEAKKKNSPLDASPSAHA